MPGCNTIIIQCSFGIFVFPVFRHPWFWLVLILYRGWTETSPTVILLPQASLTRTIKFCSEVCYLILCINSSNQTLGSAFYRICSVIMEKWVVWRKANRKSWLCILSRPSGLKSMYTKTRPKAPEKTQRGGQFAVFKKKFDFSRLRNEIRIRSLVPRERDKELK